MAIRNYYIKENGQTYRLAGDAENELWANPGELVQIHWGWKRMPWVGSVRLIDGKLYYCRKVGALFSKEEVFWAPVTKDMLHDEQT